MDQHSRTAILVAVTRGMYSNLADNPVLDDTLANELCSDQEVEQITEMALKTASSNEQRDELGSFTSQEEAWRQIFRHGAFAASSVVRLRYAEDRLQTAVIDDGVDQYVNLGAGLDTFVFRRPDLAEHLTIFELDHPNTQRFKRERLGGADLSIPDSLHFVSVDLEAESVPSALADTAYTTDRPACYSWLGVTPYLSSEAIIGTLQSIVDGSAADSELVFDFVDAEGSNPETTTPRIRRFIRMVEEMGATTGPGLELSTIEDELNRLGFELVELLSPDDQRRRYFADQPEYFGPTEHYHFAHVRVA